MLPHTLNLTIDRLSYGPAGVGRIDGKVVFVPGTVPGDEVEVVIAEEKKTYAIGHVVTLRQPSAQRCHPPCPYVSRCGGCPWQHVAYAEQLRAKETLVRELMRRIGGFANPPVLPIIPSPQEWHYRHRIRLRAEANARLGFSHAHARELVEIESCLIAGEQMTTQLHAARAWLASLRTTVRHVELVGSDLPEAADRARAIVLIGDAEGGFQTQDEMVCERFLHTHREVSGIILRGWGWRRLWGNPTVLCDLGVDGLTLKVSQGSFTQVNPAGNRALIAALLQLGEFQREQRVIELYCGAGNLGLPIACRVRELVGIERDRAAIDDARANAARVGLTNTRFLQAPARAGVRQLLHAGVHGDVVVLDPPRTGAADVIDALPRLGARMVVYVSCDPATLARDLRRLSRHHYHLDTLQSLDLFPHTYHVETIAISVLTC